MKNDKLLPLFIIGIIAVIFWQFDPPTGLKIIAYHTGIIFISTIASIITNRLPTGATTLIGITFLYY